MTANTPLHRTDRGPQTSRVTVVIPCYNDGRTIMDTVRSTIGQDQSEVIIVNDGSEDAHTISQLRTLEDEGYAVISRQNGGVGAALTTGALAASAPYIFPLGADDLLLEGSLGRLADHLDGKPDLALAWGDFLMFGDYDKYGLSAPSLDPWEITYTNDVPGLVLIRRDVLLTVGGWQLRNAPDWDLAMALAERGFAGERLPIAVFRYRRHGQRTGNDTIDRYPEVVRLLRSRHPDLFRDRRQHARLSRVPRAVRLAVDGVDRLPGLGVSRRAGVIGGIIHGHRRLVMGPEVAPIARSARIGIPSLGSRLAEVARQKVTHPTRRRI